MEALSDTAKQQSCASAGRELLWRGHDRLPRNTNIRCCLSRVNFQFVARALNVMRKGRIRHPISRQSSENAKGALRPQPRDDLGKATEKR